MPLRFHFIRQTWFIVFICVVVVVFAGGTILNFRFENIVSEQVKAALHKNPNRLYNIEFRKLKLQPFKGNISIRGIKVAPRPEILDSLNEMGVHQSLQATLSVKQISLEGINLLGLLTGEALILNEFHIKSPQIDIRLTGHKKESQDTLDPYESLYRIAQDIHNLEVHSIMLENAQLRIINPENDTIVRAYGLGANLNSFKVDTHQLHLPIDLSELLVSVDSIWSTAGKNHNVEVTGIQSSFKDSSFSLGSFKLVPLKTKEDFSAGLKYEQTWHDIKCGAIRFTGVDFEKLLFGKEVLVEQIDIEQPVAKLYKDKRPAWPYFKSHDIPSALLRKIPIPLNIRQVNVTQGYLKFQQKQSEYSDLGTLIFSSMNIGLSNLTNIKTELNKNKYAQVEGNMKFMNSGKINAKMKFDLVSEADYWSVWAEMDRMDMTDLNDFLFPVANVKISDGTVNSVLLNMNCNRLTAEGTIDVDYENARINVMKYDEATKTMSGLKFISFIANGVIRTKNEKGSAHYRQGVIDYTRAMDHPYFRFLWFAIQDGLIDTFVGLGDKEKRKQKYKDGSLFKFPSISVKIGK